MELMYTDVTTLDAFFSNVCELDLVFNFYKVPPMLDPGPASMPKILYAYEFRVTTGLRHPR